MGVSQNESYELITLILFLFNLDHSFIAIFVHYKRSINFSHPGATNLVTNVNPANTNTRNNALIAEGTIRVPAGGVIRCFNTHSISRDTIINNN